MIIDAKNLILGRMAAVAAKQALLGEDVKIVNCEQALITGDKRYIIKQHLDKLKKGQPQQGPFPSRRADYFVRRVVRGMLPYKQPRGRDALSHVKCYVGTPSDVNGAETLKVAQPSARAKKQSMTVKELCMHLGGSQ